MFLKTMNLNMGYIDTQNNIISQNYEDFKLKG